MKFEYVPAEEYAEIVGQHHETIKRKCREGYLSALKIKNKWHIMLEADYADQLRKDKQNGTRS